MWRGSREREKEGEGGEGTEEVGVMACDVDFCFFFFCFCVFFFNDTATTEIYTLSLHDALPILYFLLLEIKDS